MLLLAEELHIQGFCFIFVYIIFYLNAEYMAYFVFVQEPAVSEDQAGYLISSPVCFAVSNLFHKLPVTW